MKSLPWLACIPKVLLGICCAGMWCCGPAPVRAERAEDLTEYLGQVNAEMDKLLAEYARLPQKPLTFSANMILAHGSIVKRVPVEVLLACAEALKDAGVQRVDLNPGITSIFDPEVRSKYEALIAHIRRLGLQVAINPEYDKHNDTTITTFRGFENTVVKAYAEWAARFKPDHFVLMHEPTTMMARMGPDTTPRQWRGFIEATAAVVKRASPRTRIGAGAFAGASPREVPFYEEFAHMPELEFLTVDNYSGSHAAIARMDQMTRLAHEVHKPVYMEETWRPHFMPPGVQHKKGNSQESESVFGFGYAGFEPVDAKWLKVMTLYAATHGMESMTPFQTRCFFHYAKAPPYDGPTYDREVEQAILHRQRTKTFFAFQQLTREFCFH